MTPGFAATRRRAVLLLAGLIGFACVARATANAATKTDDDAELSRLGRQFEAIAEQIGRLGSKTIPLLAVYPPDPNAEPIILKDIITENMLLEALKKAGPSQEPSGRMTSATDKPLGVEAR